jgi:D-alanyl-D-alanine carboxypeptidase
MAGVGAAIAVLGVGPQAFAEDRYAAYVVDLQTKDVLLEDQADEARYPASLTKMMTLYLLFEAMERGEFSLNSRFTVSKNASLQAPSKLGLRRGTTITAEDAIRALVTKSANDAAVVVAEALGGTEAKFAARMTSRARELGMTSTRFVNASGLPSPSQRTTAKDMATLGEALFRDFPQHYSYFKTPGMTWGSRYARNHNRLLENVDGVDGIKTGYTRASGFNVATSVERDGRRLIAVVMGGESAAARDAQMSHIIETAYELVAQREAPSGVTLASMPMTRVGVDIDPWSGSTAMRATTTAADRPSYTSPAPMPRFVDGEDPLEEGSRDGATPVMASPAPLPVEF